MRILKFSILVLSTILSGYNITFAQQGWLSGKFKIVAISPQPSGNDNLLVFNAVDGVNPTKTFYIKLTGSELSRELSVVIMAAYYKPKTTTKVQICVTGQWIGAWQEVVSVSVFDQ